MASVADMTTHGNPADASSAPPPRKRRRRTAASGATDDCFTCRKRSVACDRKRPYCTQCIEIGKECSGYKTTLTWGVGVASRGKLRGLSLPVANKNYGGVDTKARRNQAGPRKNSGSKAKDDGPSEVDAKPTTGNNTTSQPSGSGLQPMPISAPAQPVSESPVPLKTSPPQQAWPLPRFNNNHGLIHPADVQHQVPLSDPALQRIQTTIAPQHLDRLGLPHSGSSMGSSSDHDLTSPLEFPHTPGSASFAEPFHVPVSTSYTSLPLDDNCMDNISLNSAPISTFSDPLSSHIDAAPSVTTFSDNISLGSVDTGFHGYARELIAPGELHVRSIQPDALSYDSLANDEAEEEIESDRKELAIVDSRFSSPFFHLTPRLQSLMDYYDLNICPYIVAFDGPQNPYRRHILQLAVQSEGLQHAIAALATNNIRMRNELPTSREAGFVEDFSDIGDLMGTKTASKATVEESCYKQISIDQLNMQLSSSRAAQDDSVLATVLILSLFHVCDSGFSKFKTQLAGVQKLLSLRSPEGQSDFTRWVQMLFVWFDVMTATVNDREMQIKPESLDMLDYSANLGALEQFSGCDGRLFKLIAAISRLNLLAQGRPVRVQEGTKRKSNPTARDPSASKSPLVGKKLSTPPLSAADYDKIDGNGWGQTIIPEDDIEASDTVDDLPAGIEVPDTRREFWKEWHEIRSHLQAWQMDTSMAPPSRGGDDHNNSDSDSDSPLPMGEFDIEQCDLIHINESFRFSALLYTERLGHPLLPSAHPIFQQYVSQALYHITALPVTSCVNKFLLWPLFITGTECVDESHRQIIRSRCVELQRESGFFNNISCLRVLERVWRDVSLSPSPPLPPSAAAASSSSLSADDFHHTSEMRARRRDSEASRTGLYGQAFRWRKAMDRVGGEYIVI